MNEQIITITLPDVPKTLTEQMCDAAQLTPPGYEETQRELLRLWSDEAKYAAAINFLERRKAVLGVLVEKFESFLRHYSRENVISCEKR